MLFFGDFNGDLPIFAVVCSVEDVFIGALDFAIAGS